MTKRDSLLRRLRRVCLRWPETTETTKWGHPTFLVGKKTFAVLDRYHDRWAIAFRALPLHQAELIARAEFFAAPYAARHGWVCRDAEGAIDWRELTGLLEASYRLFALKPMRVVAGPFPAPIAAALREGKTLRIKAGTGSHRFIGIWVVVVEGRVFVRSWSVKERSWYRTFLKTPRGFVKLGTRAMPVRAVRIRSTRLRKAVDRAYLEKYSTPWERKYAKDLGSPKSRATTIELRPATKRAIKGTGR